eukprot:Rhum_TRINITY_DN14342_c1_g2::Rhum_TRINITY_DN14342_c1_g2_i1::g.81149::m.81149
MNGVEVRRHTGLAHPSEDPQTTRVHDSGVRPHSRHVSIRHPLPHSPHCTLVLRRSLARCRRAAGRGVVSAAALAPHQVVGDGVAVHTRPTLRLHVEGVHVSAERRRRRALPPQRGRGCPVRVACGGRLASVERGGCVRAVGVAGRLPVRGRLRPHPAEDDHALRLRLRRVRPREPDAAERRRVAVPPRRRLRPHGGDPLPRRRAHVEGVQAWVELGGPRVRGCAEGSTRAGTRLRRGASPALPSPHEHVVAHPHRRVPLPLRRTRVRRGQRVLRAEDVAAVRRRRLRLAATDEGGALRRGGTGGRRAVRAGRRRGSLPAAAAAATELRFCATFLPFFLCTRVQSVVISFFRCLVFVGGVHHS